MCTCVYVVTYFNRPEDPSIKYLTANVVNGMCREKRVFYRVVSGLHAAINVHVASHYPTEPSNPFEERTWGANMTLFERFFSPKKTFGEGPNWLKNIYFNYLLVLRAITKAAPLWNVEHFYTDQPEQDEQTSDIVAVLAKAAPEACPVTFDERILFTNEDDEDLRSAFREKFRNVSRIMDCVECSTCRLWGKLKTHGLGTAMKILFAPETETGVPIVQLRRNEVVALFNTLAQYVWQLLFSLLAFLCMLSNAS
eukprot:m.175270 g.175270  ORF g.175270 m.175270 type:complete len:253 (-) comp14608_c0_seq13:625-1383(-)